jgi:hypothetical protein
LSVYHFLAGFIIVGKAGAYQIEALTGLYSHGRLLTMPKSIRQGWK